MALPILDGNQSATTLSTILSSGQHITAHTVVSLGTQAITDIVNATSANLTNTQLRASAVTVGGTVTVGNSLTVSSLPAISGTVTVGQIQGYQHASTATNGPFNADVMLVGEDIEAAYAAGLVVIPAARGGGVLGGRSGQGDTPICVYGDNGSAVTISGTVTVGNTVTISGTVTANPTGTQTIAGTVTAGNLPIYNETDTIIDGNVVGSIVFNVNGANAFGASGITVGSIPSLPAGTNRIGVVTIGGGSVTIGAGTSQIGSVTASISGTVPISISSVTVGNSVTIGSLPAISGTVTANTFALQGTAVTTSNFTSTTASTVLANFNATREVLTIFNEGAGNLHICAGATCTTIAYQVRLSAGDYYEVPNHQTTITHSAVFATAGTARVTEVS